jgi:hypothetical protein
VFALQVKLSFAGARIANAEPICGLARIPGSVAVGAATKAAALIDQLRAAS